MTETRLDFRSAIVRICGRELDSAGTGFFVGREGHVVTCNHVIETAKRDETGNRVRIELMANRKESWATIRPEWTRSVKDGDISILLLDEPLPAGVEPLALAANVPAACKVVHGFGFPKQYNLEGFPGSARILENLTFEGHPAIAFQSDQFTLGFSGGPAVDNATGLVVGVISVISQPDLVGQLRGAGLLIPSATVCEICPDLVPGFDPQLIEYIGAVRTTLEQPAYELPVDRPGPPEAPPGFVCMSVADLAGETSDIVAQLSKAERERRVLVLTGRAGLGKTSTLRFVGSLCWHAPESVGLSRPHVPIFGNLPMLASATGSIPERLHHLVATDRELHLEYRISADQFHGWLRDPTICKLFLFDGLDEVDFDSRRQVIRFVKSASENYQCVTVIGTRSVPNLQSFNFEKLVVELQPLNDLQRRALVESHLGDSTAAFLKNVERERDLRDICGFPLLMILLMSIWLNRRELPTSRTEIYEDLQKSWQKRWEQRGLIGVFGDWSPHATDILAAVAGAASVYVNPPAFRDIEPDVKQFLRVGLNATAIQMKRAREFIDFFAEHSGVMHEDRGRVAWAHKSFQDFLTAQAFANDVETKTKTFQQAAGLWSASHLSAAVTFFLSIANHHPEFESTVAGILSSDEGPLFIARSAQDGVVLSETLRVLLARRLRELSRAEYENAPRTLCEMLFSGPTALSTFLKLRSDSIVRAELLDMMTDETVDIDLRTDVMHSLRDDLTTAERETIDRSVTPETLALLADWTRLHERNRPFWDKINKIMSAAGRGEPS